MLSSLRESLFSLSMCVLNNLSIRKHLNFRNEFKNTYVKPLIAAAIMGVVTWVVYYGLFAITKRPSISMLAAILIAIVVYLIAFVVVTGTTGSRNAPYANGNQAGKGSPYPADLPLKTEEKMILRLRRAALAINSRRRSAIPRRARGMSAENGKKTVFRPGAFKYRNRKSVCNFLCVFLSARFLFQILICGESISLIRFSWLTSEAPGS